jgi:hypothetical protein
LQSLVVVVGVDRVAAEEEVVEGRQWRGGSGGEAAVAGLTVGGDVFGIWRPMGRSRDLTIFIFNEVQLLTPPHHHHHPSTLPPLSPPLLLLLHHHSVNTHHHHSHHH